MATQLPTDVPKLHELILYKDSIILDKESIIQSKDTEIDKLLEIIRGLKRQHFGSSSEKVTTQMGLFNEAEELVVQAPAEQTEVDTIPDPANDKKRPVRKPLPGHLPRERKVIELAEHERRCPCNNELMSEIGEEVAEQLDVVVQLKVIQTARKKYACRNCQEGVKIAPVPVQAIPKSLASEGLLAAVATWKYVDHLPLYRIESMFARHAVEVSRSTLASWMIKGGTLVQPLIDLMDEQLIDGSYLQMDESRLQVLKEPGKRAQSLSQMWVRGCPGENPIVLFNYDPTRASDVPIRLLEGFQGALQVDGYGGYNAVAQKPGITRGGCFAHCRRRFFESAKTSKKAGIANKGLKFIQKLYKIEDHCRQMTPDERYQFRQVHSVPLLAQMRSWLTEVIPTVPPQSAAGRALTYADSEWKYLVRYVDDGRYEIDNNFIENKIRPFALGRKNWLFSSTVEGAQASANLYSLVVTALANGLEPYGYLRHVFEQLPQASTLSEVEALLPHNFRKRTA